MELHQTIEALRTNLEDLQRLHKQQRLRRILKYVLIGFLIGRHALQRIQTLQTENKRLVQSIADNINKLDVQLQDLSQRIKTFSETFIQLTTITKSLAEYTDRLDHAQSIFLSLERHIIEYRTALQNLLRTTIEQQISQLKKHVMTIEHSSAYLIYADEQATLSQIEGFHKELEYIVHQGVLSIQYATSKRKELEELRQQVANYNHEYVKQEKRTHSHLWHVGRGLQPLDDEQQTAIIRDDTYNLVVAAAGSGKTEVLITRIAYLIQAKGILPHRILAIAYQRKDVKQIKNRLRNNYGIAGVNVCNFHQLGIKILRRAEKITGLTTLNETKDERAHIVREILNGKLEKDSLLLSRVTQYAKYLDEPTRKSDVEIEYRQRQLFPDTSIDNRKVRSQAEKEILDFFLTWKLNGRSIAIEYEPVVEGLAPKTPDFYLPQYDLYFEHWAINTRGEVPEDFDQSSKEYVESMEYKKRWFRENKKPLVETFSHEYNKDNPEPFLQSLRERTLTCLHEQFNEEFEFTPKSYEEMLEVVRESSRHYLSKEQLTYDIVNFIKNAKTYGFTPEQMHQRLKRPDWTRKQRSFGTLATMVYETYESVLITKRRIDFEDMINRAIAELAQNSHLYNNAFDHILIDEYQDITVQCHKLVQQLLDHNHRCKLFCVGDDWQSIMGFAGSNLGLFVNFEEQFDHPKISQISTNYRSVKSIVDAGEDLIREKYDCQRPKITHAHRGKMNFINVLTLVHETTYETEYYKQMIQDCVGRIRFFLEDVYAPSDILVLSRFLRGFPRLSILFKDRAEEMGVKITLEPRAKSRVRLLTIHKAKGLQAKIVFILNVIKGTHGLPCEIEDSGLYMPARENYPTQNHLDEERRILYVAITRAMEQLFIYTWEPAYGESAKSPFLEDIEAHTMEQRLPY